MRPNTLRAACARAAGRSPGTTRDGRSDSIAFRDEAAVLAALRSATHILSSVPPAEGSDPVLTNYGDAIALAPASWVGYLSSTGVYGDAGGAWVDESAPIKGRRPDRNAADAAWQALRSDVSVFRLPGIYGPGRSILERIAEGRAHRIDLPEQVFSRVHVDDIAGGVMASFRGPAGVYNLADDEPCHQNKLVEWGCAMLGAPLPPVAIDRGGRAVARRACFLCREPPRREWPSETPAWLDAALSKFSRGAGKLRGANR
jgi:nucleoside-diphosphate-sugar epimerase